MGVTDFVWHTHTHTDGPLGERDAVVDVPGVAEVQLARGRGRGWKPSLHRHAGGETFCHRRQRGHPHRDLREELRALPQARQRVSRRCDTRNTRHQHTADTGSHLRWWPSLVWFWVCDKCSISYFISSSRGGNWRLISRTWNKWSNGSLFVLLIWKKKTVEYANLSLDLRKAFNAQLGSLFSSHQLFSTFLQK